MTVSLLVITHNQIGQELIDTATCILDNNAFDIHFISVSANLKPQNLGRYADQIKNTLDELDRGSGILILTDIFGATPYNLAHYFATDRNINIVSGINLPMLLRVLSYPQQTLQQLSSTAIEGALKGVVKD
ncbi:MAG: PTS system mannose-specific IIA component [Gammaproteobacteria bacterium]|jgi:PTS system mannose-specific IIA component